jgi:hypothetical protein
VVDFRWPDGRKAAVSLTYDDGTPSHLSLAAPIMNEYGVRGTFYINPREADAASLAPWRQIAQAGHEVGNHTVSHPCSQNFEFISRGGRKGLEQMSLDDIEAEIVEAGRRLQAGIPEQERVSFAFPCYQPFVGRGAKRQSYVPVVLKHCVAGRGRGEQPNDPRYCDLGYLWSFPCEQMTAPTLIGLVEQAAAQGRWAILTFHGIHEGHLSVGNGDLAELCRHLTENKERVWTAPVVTVAQYVARWQEQVQPETSH